jgi:hypothetical protein
MFRDYLETEEAYAQCRDFWEETFQSLVDGAEQGDHWNIDTPHIIRLGDGSVYTTIEYMGVDDNPGISPILTAKNDFLAKAITVTQPTYADWDKVQTYYPTGWIDVELWPRNPPVDYDHDICSIHVLLTKESLDWTREIMIEWIKPDTQIFDLKSLVRSEKWLSRCPRGA